MSAVATAVTSVVFPLVFATLLPTPSRAVPLVSSFSWSGDAEVLGCKSGARRFDVTPPLPELPTRRLANVLFDSSSGDCVAIGSALARGFVGFGGAATLTSVFAAAPGPRPGVNSARAVQSVSARDSAILLSDTLPLGTPVTLR
jgi:hypothetical protein